MTTWPPRRAINLIDRRSERDLLLKLVMAVRGGESRTLVICGDPGVGKTALLDYLTGHAAGCQVLRVGGVQSEMELAFAGLHQLCAPLLGRLERLPAPQRNALRVAFGLADGPASDRFLLGLAVLSLLSEVAEERPLICLVDDQHWLDRESAQALGFVARRLAADRIGIVFGTRVLTEELSGLPQLNLAGLQEEDAQALLDSVLAWPLDAQVRDRIVAETYGNPLALLELPRGLTQGQLAGGFGLPDAMPLSGRIEESFRRQLEGLPPETQHLLQVAAADPSGDLPLVWRAADRLGISVQAAAPAIDAGLAEFGESIRFRHPMLRSVVYRSLGIPDRRSVHLALSEATDPVSDPDRRVWHRAQAVEGVDEEVAADLERSASRAQARGGPAAAAAFLERAIILSNDPGRRADRMLAAAQANLQAGAYRQALELLSAAEEESRPLDELQSARVRLLRGHVAFTSGLGNEGPPLLLEAARRLEPLNLDMARETYLTAWTAALFAGRLATRGNLHEVSRAARELPWSAQPGKAELILDALTLLVTSGPAAAAPALRRALAAFAETGTTLEEEIRWGWFAHAASMAPAHDGYGQGPGPGHAQAGHRDPQRVGVCAGCRSGIRYRPPDSAAISAVIGQGWKPLTTSHTPSENSQAATGITGSTASPVNEECCPNSVANTAMMSRGPPMSPITGMMRGTRRDRYIKEPSSRALMPGIRLCESRNVQL